MKKTLLLFLLLLIGCEYSYQKKRMPDTVMTTDYSVAFDKVYSEVLNPSCLQCHSSNNSTDLSTYEKVVSKINEIKKTTINSRQMPKSPADYLSDRQLSILSSWIKNGTPQGIEIIETKEQIEPNFDSIYKNIIKPKCLACHSTGKQMARLPMETYDQILNPKKRLVIPFNTANSRFLNSVVEADDEDVMPPLTDDNGDETGFKRLNKDEIFAIEQWISNGAQK